MHIHSGRDRKRWHLRPLRFNHTAYRRITPHAIAPMAVIRQQVGPAVVLAQNLKGPICERRPLVKFA